MDEKFVKKVSLLFLPQGIVRIGAVNADEHQQLGGRYGVKGFPTIKIFGANKNKPNDYQGIHSRTSDKGHSK